ncbi:MAG: SDR family NAD(P)-dependent oxidoreductase [Gammaproteobacteria bacterium]|nr:SDR family NAD(P)-dependent oxidoreductase [Gammaproteobacteria bacterium]
MSTPVCAIVGAGDGLGRALAARFAREGFTLALLSRTAAGSQAALTAATLAAPGLPHAFHSADATQPEHLQAALERVAAECGDIDVLIYNARGGYAMQEPLEVRFDELEEIFRLEVMGAFAAAKAVMPAMIARGRGSVIYSSATAAFRGSATNPLFAIGKFGLRALAQSLAKAYARRGVHVAHMRLDCTLDVPMVREWLGERFDVEQTANCDDVAETYWWVHQQPRSAWSNEVELRPYSETWTF